MKRSALAAVAVETDDAHRHLRPVESERKAKFAALDHDVARVLGPHRGAATLYGYLASAWFEFADPHRLFERKGKKIRPGDWVEVDYAQFMAIAGTRAKASIIRWLRILAEEEHPCPWGRCGDEHPLIVVQRQGRSRPNRYRKWQCQEDVLVIRPRVRSQRLSEAAQKRVAAGQRLNGIQETACEVSADADTPFDAQIALPDLEVFSQDFTEAAAPVSLKSLGKTSDDEHLEAALKSSDKTSERLVSELQEVSRVNHQKSSEETSLREKRPKQERAAKGDGAAAIEQSDEIDAIACEVVDAVVLLAQRVEPDYPHDRAHAVARRLATAVLQTVEGDASCARAAILRATADRRLARAANPIGLLIRGIAGDQNGRDRFLLTEPAMPSGPAAAPFEPAPPRHFQTNAPTESENRERTEDRAERLAIEQNARADAILEALSQTERSDIHERALRDAAVVFAKERLGSELFYRRTLQTVERRLALSLRQTQTPTS